MADRHGHRIEPLRPGSPFAYLVGPDGHLREPSGPLAVVDAADAPALVRLLDAGATLAAARDRLDALANPLA